MRLTTAISRQNTYTFQRPVTKDGKLTGYARILLFLDNDNSSWNRIELVNKVLNRKLIPIRDRGTMINIFATMRANDILEYNKSTKTWSKGSNFEEYLNKFLSEYRA